jgi:hypothetical protein
MVKPSLRTKSIGTKVTDEEYVELERAAQTGGQDFGRVVPGGDAEERERRRG